MINNSAKKHKITLTENQLSFTLKEIKKVNKQIDSFFNDLKKKKEKFNTILDEQYDIFISNLMKYSSKTPMLESRKQKVFKVIKTLLEKTQKVEKYHQTLVKLSLFDFYHFIKNMY